MEDDSMYDSSRSRFTYGAIFGLILGLLIGSYFGPIKGTNTDSAENENMPRLELGTTTRTSAISVSTQEAGETVDIDKVFLKDLGWVAIHESNDGAPGNILGAQLFDPGEWDGKVVLLRNTAPGKIYFAALRSDDGDRIFDMKKDLPVITEGREVIATFRTEGIAIPPRNETVE